MAEEKKKKNNDPNQNTETITNILNQKNKMFLKDPSTGKWYVQYDLPGQGGFSVLYEIDETQMKTLFDKGEFPDIDKRINFNNYIDKKKVFFGGNVAEVAGKGNFNEEVQNVIHKALDQADLPKWMTNDPAAMSLFWLKVTDGRSQEWYFNQLSQLQSFKKRYPGVKALMERGNLTMEEAINGFNEFEGRLRDLYIQVGLPANAVSHAKVGALMNKGYSIEQVSENMMVWKRMRDYEPALKAFNQVLKASGKKPLGGKEMVKFLKGQAPQEVYDIYEASSLKEAAKAAGFGNGIFSADDALKFALETDGAISINDAYAGFQEAARQALMFRHQLDVEQYGLTTDDLIDLQFGRKPRSGKEVAEVGVILARIQQSAKAQQSASPYVGFTPTGTPQAASLSGLRQQT